MARGAVHVVVAGVKSMLVDIGFDDGVCLDVYGVSPAIGLDTEGEVGVGVNIPVETAEQPQTTVLVTECSVTCSLNAPVLRQFGGDAPVKARMGWRVGSRGARLII